MKKIKVILLGLVIILLTNCLNPLTYDPTKEITINTVVSGEIDAWLKDNSVLWIVNKSRTVDIRDVRITRDDNDPAYPIIYPPGDMLGSGASVPHGTSLASYHKPAPNNPIPWYTVDITYPTDGITFPLEQPDWWNSSYAIDYGAYPPTGPLHTISVKKQMPRGQDYVIVFYRTSEGQLMVVDEDTEKHTPSPGDTTDNGQNVLPPSGNQTDEKSIAVYNASASVIIDSIDIVQNNFRATTNGNTIKGGNSYSIYLKTPERNFDIQIKYHYIGSSTQHIKTNKIAITGIEYIVFYKQFGDNFVISKTTDMNLLMSNADKNDFIVNNDVNSVKFNILNESSAMRIVGLTFKKYRAAANDLMYIKEDTDFISRGPIGAAGGNDSVVFTSSEAQIDSGESYTINLIGEDYRDGIGKGKVIIEVQRPLYVGGAVTLTVTEAMVQYAKQQNTPAITYQVTADGGLGDPHNPSYDTTKLTFTFDSVPPTIPTFSYTGYTGSVRVGPLTATADPLEFTASCTATVDTQITVNSTNTQSSNVTSAAHYVLVFKSQPITTQPIKTTRYIFNNAYVENLIVQRNTDHQLRWVLKYDVVNYEDGIETSRQTITKNQVGEWLVDSSTNSGYISFNKVGLLKIGPRPVGALVYSGNDKAGVSEWELYESVVFGQKVDGHIIENMPYQSVPLWLGPWQIGTKQVYGLQVTLIIKN